MIRRGVRAVRFEAQQADLEHDLARYPRAQPCHTGPAATQCGACMSLESVAQVRTRR